MNKRVAAIITEYWDISHADVIITKMLDGFRLDGREYRSTIDIVAMYVDQFPPNDISRDIAARHGIPLYGSIREALLAGEAEFELDGVILIGEHGAYPDNELGQTLYPRRIFFEQVLNVMLEFDRIVPVYSDKGFAVVYEDIVWMYEQIVRHRIPFMSSSVVPYAPQRPVEEPFPNGAPLARMFGFCYGPVERYVYHTLEMMQSVAENRARGESGIRKVKAYKDDEAIERLLSADWLELYRTLGGFINLRDLAAFPAEIKGPVFVELDYADGLRSGILLANPEISTFVSAYQAEAGEPPVCREFMLQGGKPYIHFGRLVLEIEKFLHTGRPPHPVERSLLTTGAIDACMRSLHSGEAIDTPHLLVRY
ncbi:hypothetical protein [Paenibacillus ginsengarvi]|uniref:Uncharacterized protein n=1 Tax=Paenibacillus ginsengarvi TaxID=400777 RepID=A0A3B0CJD7_9BACL|nr:hypothetical protein [Paenibacillus ginsengarvi]RKN84399.1 hypothetical protein D7M11_12990 [Paenibacillus ginsengarvi]